MRENGRVDGGDAGVGGGDENSARREAGVGVAP